MSRRKGLSLEEKRTKMLEIFHERKEFFQLKELEKLGPKEKGVIAQAVKDVVQSLVDDGLVDTDKIGTGVYFWAFPSKASATLAAKVASLEASIEAADSKLRSVEEAAGSAKSGREEGEERGEVLAALERERERGAALEAQLREREDNDPALLEKAREETKMALEAANRWTDNLFAIKSWAKRKFFIEEEAFNKSFGIPEDLDYIEE